MKSLSLNHSLKKHARAADRLMLGIIWALFLLSMALSPLHDTWQWAFVIGLPVALGVSALIMLRGARRTTSLVVAAALMVMTALHIHQAAGANEAHFGIFVLLAFLLCYRDWLTVVTAALVIALHHLSFNFLQELGYGVMCLTESGIGRVLVHAAPDDHVDFDRSESRCDGGVDSGEDVGYREVRVIHCPKYGVVEGVEADGDAAESGLA